MKRSRAFILAEQLMTIMLQAGFILVLCASFYQVISFYTRTQQVLTARNHAERVISFMDDKIRNAGLGLWRCGNSEAIRSSLASVPNLKTDGEKGYRLPIALTWLKDGTKTIPQKTKKQKEGDVLNLLYAQRDSSSGGSELILFTGKEKTINETGTVKLLDSDTASRFQKKGKSSNATSQYVLDKNKNNLNNYAVAESVGVPFFLSEIDKKILTITTNTEIMIPAATELMYLKFIQMFVHDNNDEHGRQFAFTTIKFDNYDGWGTIYNQEKGILDIYMNLDTDKNIFTLWVLATGGYDASMKTQRPDAWPKEANPAGATDKAANTAWLNSDYCHHIVYVSRATWKLNNIPQNFTWN